MEIFKEGYFSADWNKYKPCKILGQIKNKMLGNEGAGFGRNDDGPHTLLDLSSKSIQSIKEDQLQTHLEMILKQIKGQVRLENDKEFEVNKQIKHFNKYMYFQEEFPDHIMDDVQVNENDEEQEVNSFKQKETEYRLKKI